MLHLKFTSNIHFFIYNLYNDIFLNPPYQIVCFTFFQQFSDRKICKATIKVRSETEHLTKILDILW